MQGMQAFATLRDRLVASEFFQAEWAKDILFLRRECRLVFLLFLRVV